MFFHQNDDRLGNMGKLASSQCISHFQDVDLKVKAAEKVENDNNVLRFDRLKRKYERFYSLKDAARNFGDRFIKIVTNGKISVSKYQSMINCQLFAKGESFNSHLDQSGKAFYSGLQTCKKPECPMCGAKIASRRAKEVRTAIDFAYDKEKGTTHMASFTLPHYLSQHCQEVFDNLTKSYKSFNGHRIFKTIYNKFGSFGSITAKETNYSFKNGWHHHIHVLYLCKNKITKEQQEEFRIKLCDHWVNCLLKLDIPIKNLDSLKKHSFDIKYNISSSDYLAKQNMCGTAGDLELTLSNNKKSYGKKGVHPLQLLDLYKSTKDNKYALKYLEYVNTMHGTNRIAFSKGLKEHIKIKLLKNWEICEEQTEIAQPLSLEYTQEHRKFMTRHKLDDVVLRLSEISLESVVKYFKNKGFDDVKIVLTASIRNVSKEHNDRLINIMKAENKP